MAKAIVSQVSMLLRPQDQRAVNPSRELSGSKLNAVKEFLTLFRLKRDELHVQLLALKEKLNQNLDNYGGNILPEKQKTEYILVLVNMFLFHSHILLRKSDDRKLISSDEKQLLKDYFFRLLQTEKEYLPAEFCL